MTMITTNGQTLTERQRGLAACACLMAQGDMERLEPAVRMALDNGVTINELKEAFSQLSAADREIVTVAAATTGISTTNRCRC